ncbi:GNAT family N-acetyltransferase [Aeromicrobium wangtongii]|uniref:GNAT family N-acetyltransferase n=1 Tax=Aeromicrobium wangtongii TaxID=2969247 RepID=A0ABY5M755_9ACTN|nr:GNAT family N-acetyltransferase [Aeromicrobium wangtongii]MCD9199652.1 N-acetyltransferase family protein [Aeromicrobium wangtongii]MCL3817400.1 N-acetyltransferase family protein [Aeromicrobium wangtongii]UUP14003.1 GNAT family N-acetyltransferase [Aeromicrobium wangtongii]
MTIRDAVPSDAADLLVIHNEAVRDTTAIWDESEVDLADRSAWLEGRLSAGFPVLVAEVEGVVAGYASYGPWRPKSGYRHTVENSLYVRSTHQGRGLASVLIDALIVRAREAQLHRMVAMIESTNTLSIELHARRGFRTVGELTQVGQKFGRWLDLTIMQLDLD